MSAFIVGEETMRKVVTAISKEHGFYKTDVRRGTLFEGLGPDEIGRMLYGLNVRAVDGRYGETNPVPLYRHRPILRSPVSYVKAMDCLLYQCSEEATENDPLMDALVRAKGHLCAYIVRALPEWEKDGDWGD